MALVYPHIQLSEVVEEHPSLIPMINRFGIRLGLGDKSVKMVCEAHGLDPDFLLTVINTYLNEDYFPEKKLQTFHTSQIIDYLTKTNLYYARYQLPNIERHLQSFIQQSAPDNPSLTLIGKFFHSFKTELMARIQQDGTGVNQTNFLTTLAGKVSRLPILATPTTHGFLISTPNFLLMA